MSKIIFGSYLAKCLSKILGEEAVENWIDTRVRIRKHMRDDLKSHECSGLMVEIERL